MNLDERPANSPPVPGEAGEPKLVKDATWHVSPESTYRTINRYASDSLISTGIGDSRAAKILKEADIDPFVKVGTLDEDQLNAIRQVIEKQGMIEGDLRKEISLNIKRLIEIQSYRGLRHRRSLPVRGQRTHTNARTRKGPRKGTVAGKKKVTK